MENKLNKVVLTGTFIGSYENFRRAPNKKKNKKNNLNIIKLFFKKRKK